MSRTRKYTPKQEQGKQKSPKKDIYKREKKDWANAQD